jgi:hypothetical protein
MVSTSSGSNELSFAGNGLRFATEKEAEMWLDDLMCRWYAVTAVRVDPSDDPVNYSTVDGRTLVEVKS